MSDPLAYTVNDFLKLVGIGRTHFYKAVNSGQLRVCKSGGRTLVRAADARAYLESLPAFEPRQAA